MDFTEIESCLQDILAVSPNPSGETVATLRQQVETRLGIDLSAHKDEFKQLVIKHAATAVTTRGAATRCKATKRNGMPCKQTKDLTDGYCIYHNTLKYRGDA